MQEISTPQSLSSEKAPDSTSTDRSTPKGSSSSTIYRHINEIPLYIFIDALVDDKIHGLVVAGHPTEDELYAAWADLMIQYNEGLGDNESRLFFSLHKQILGKEITLQQVDFAIEVLRGVFVPEVLTFLNGVFFTCIEYDPLDEDDRDRKLTVFRNQKASIRMAIDMKRIQYDAIKKKKSEGGKPDRTYFQTILLNLSDYAKYEINDKITVFQYCERLRRLNKFLEQEK